VRKFIRSLPSIFFSALIVFMASPGHAALIDNGAYTTDSQSGLDWLDENFTAGLTYTEATTLYSGWRPATNAEVEDLFWKAFDGFFPTEADGSSYSLNGGVYPDHEIDVTNFFNLFGPHDDRHAFGMYEDEDGILRQMGVKRNIYGPDSIYGPEYTASQEHHRDSASSSSSGTFLVRDSNTPPLNGLVTLWDDYPPEMLNLTAECNDNPYGSCGSSSPDGWVGEGVEYLPVGFVLQSFNLSMHPSFDTQATPWMKILGFDFSPFTDGGGCNINNSIYHAGTKTSATDLGNGKCRLTVDNDYIFLPAGMTGTGIAHEPDGYVQYWSWSVTNLALEILSENIEIDFNPWDASNIIRPKSTYLITVQINTTSIADGDTYDFDAADVDLATLRVGPDLAEVAALPLTADFDGDGDTDYIFGFRMQETGISCLDTTISIAGRTLSGDPIVGHAAIVPVDCEETLAIDVDPFNNPNIVRPDDDYTVTVGIMGMNTTHGDAIDFNPATELDAASLKFGIGEAPNVAIPVAADLDGDTNQDLLVGFSMLDSGIACGDTELEVTGLMYSGLPIIATDIIETTDCATGTCHP
jgi:hypothetical protein